MTPKLRIAVLTVPSPQSWIAINAVVERFGPVAVLAEARMGKGELIAKRVKRQGVVTVAGQIGYVMLQKLNVVVTPGAGFGAAGEGFFRISAFNSRANALEVGRRLEGERTGGGIDPEEEGIGAAGDREGGRIVAVGTPQEIRRTDR